MEVWTEETKVEGKREERVEVWTADGVEETTGGNEGGKSEVWTADGVEEQLGEMREEEWRCGRRTEWRSNWG